MIERPDVISPDTMLDLKQAADKYVKTVAVPLITKTGRLAAAMSGLRPIDDETKTLITAVDASSLAVSIYGEQAKDLLNIDLPEEGPAVIVEPGYYAVDDDPESDVLYMRMPIRNLTEAEGRGLVADVKEIIALMPADRLRVEQ